MTQGQKLSDLVLKFLDFDRHDPITATLCEWLTWADCVQLCQTCKYLYDRRTTILSDFIDINTRLQYYFDDPIAFRAQQRKWQALLSGSFALQASFGSDGAAPVLDIYADDVGGEMVISYLKTAENYKASAVKLNVRVRRVIHLL